MVNDDGRSPGANRRPLTDQELDETLRSGQRELQERLLNTVDTSRALDAIVGGDTEDQADDASARPGAVQPASRELTAARAQQTTLALAATFGRASHQLVERPPRLRGRERGPTTGPIPPRRTVAVSGAARPAPPDRGFWQSLTDTEQQAFTTAASSADYPIGAVLWEEGQVADHLVLILDGFIKVTVVRNGFERVIAIRGPGDIIGERAALLLRQRSTTIVALSPVRALRMTTREFAGFLTDHPRAVAVLEREMYERMGESPATEASFPHSEVPDASPPPWAGQMCSILFTDIAGFSARVRNDDDRLEIRQTMYGLLREAFEHSDVPWNACYREDRGDGALIVVPPEMPTRSVIDPMLALLTAGLRRHNHRSSDALRIQLRLALNVGPVMPDSEGVSGSAIIYTARLLDAPILKARLAETSSDLGFIASDFVYKNVVMHAPGFVIPDSYQKVNIPVKGAELTGWMHLSTAT
jgi:hypothetical protein